MAKVCPKCGAEVLKGKFCCECGERLVSELVLSTSDCEKTETTKLSQYSIFDYEKRYDGTHVIKKLLDPYAFNITIPDSVIAIEKSAFENSCIIEVSIPNGVRYIGERAFANCKHLKNINIPESVALIGKEAFLNCEKLNLILSPNISVEEDVLKGTLTESLNNVANSQQNGSVSINKSVENKLYTRNGKSVVIGEYPQTIKDKKVVITDKIDDRGYYLGDDGYYYAKEICQKDSYLKLSNGENAKINKTYYFKVEPIKWEIIYDTNDNHYTVLSEKVLDSKMFDVSSINYEQSYLRKFLNNEFLNIAFSNEQIQNCIAYITVNSTKYDKFSYSFKDRLFILTYDEVIANYYGLNNNNARTKVPTDYALAKGVITSGTNALWWLRTTSSSHNTIRGILGDGSTSDYFAHSDNKGCGVVPAMRVKLN